MTQLVFETLAAGLHFSTPNWTQHDNHALISAAIIELKVKCSGKYFILLISKYMQRGWCIFNLS